MPKDIKNLNSEEVSEAFHEKTFQNTNQSRIQNWKSDKKKKSQTPS